MAELKPCHMCTNARVDPDLTDDNDLSYHGVGDCASNFRLMMRSGARKPVMLEVEAWLGERWGLIGSYEPKFCPECGRELTEYRRVVDGK